ncbi:MAG TPA: RusA family crossover junction endodeoxyribonuclease [Candidatus Limnocylindrales bacterium]|nr:RusA family crossover junction endodeoxyribonuclease [Candidatus Limnocylindrales bacterium]
MIAVFPPEQPVVRFTAFGIPQPQGSARMVPVSQPCRVCQRREQRITSDNPKVPAWRKAIRKALDAEDVSPLPGPVRVSLAFMLRRPKGHRGARGLLPSAPVYPVVKPDIDKLARAVLDALTGPAFNDDSQVVELIVLKHYATGTPGVDIRIEAMA